MEKAGRQEQVAGRGALHGRLERLLPARASVFALALGAMVAATDGGCITDSSPIYTPPSEHFVTGVCSCGLCWDRPFCTSPTFPGLFPPPPCTGDFLEAVPASRLASYRGPRERDFFCAAVMGAVYDHPALMVPPSRGSPEGGWCPNPGSPNRARLIAMDACRDVLFECRDPSDPEFAGCSELPTDTSACPSAYQRGVEVSGCTNLDDESGVLKVVIACAHGRPLTVPSGPAPERYCFTACIDPFALEYGGTADSCEDTLFDPPEVTAGSYAWVLSGTGSTVTITVAGDTAEFPIVGRVAFHSPRCLPGDTCPAELSFVEASVPESFSLGGRDFSELVFRNPVPIRRGRVTPSNFSESRIELPPNAQLFATAEVTGLADRSGVLLTSTDAIRGTIRWGAHDSAIAIDASFTESGTATTVALHIRGAIPNRAPLANAGPDLIVECAGPEGAMVPLTAAASFDPDDPQNALDELSYNWGDAGKSPGSRFAAPGREVAVRQPLGVADYDLTVRDTDGSSTTDSVRVTVRDSSGPVFDPSVLRLCIPVDNRLRHFEPADYEAAFSDLCQDGFTFEVVSIGTSQPDTGAFTPDTHAGAAGSFCVRGEREPETTSPRRYTVTVAATDRSGNTSTASFPVVVPNGACPRGTWDVPAVADTDPACGGGTPDAGTGADAGPPILIPPGCACRAAAPPRSLAGPGACLAIALLVVACRRRPRRTPG